ncbi:MAG: FAD-dependent oxidoreductase [Proteobacteria bacterium]|nr:FAD-dependent oxidoreductase [Pseudomonadota bacterium]
MGIAEPDASDSYDVIVLGAGAGGMAAAVVAASEGLKTLVIEKTDYVGGTTALSGGMVWVPNNSKMEASGLSDRPEDAQAYLDATAGQGGTGGDCAALRQIFLAEAPGAIDYFDRNSHVHLVPLAFYPDYYPDKPGATLGGRVMEPLALDARELGDSFKLLRPPLPEFTLFGGMMVARPDIAHFRGIFRSPASALKVARLILSYAVDRTRLHRGANLVLGNALAGRLLKSLLALGVPIRRNTVTNRLIAEDRRIVGIEIATPSGPSVIEARRGVVLAAGGFSHSPDLRARYLPGEAGMYSAAAEGNSGDGLKLALAAGAGVPSDNASNAFWAPVSCFTRTDGSTGVYPHTVTDRGKPGMLAVNQDGRRFTNESNSYHDFVQAMFRSHNHSPTIPSHLLCDRRSLWQYGLGAVKPMALRLAPYLRSGYLVKASSLGELAQKIGVDPGHLAETVTTYNADAVRGEDTAFGRGSNAYHKYVGDPAIQPNPCMRPVQTPPFFAVTLYPGDLGTAAGVQTGGNGEVLGRDGEPIPGLYACGNDMNSVMAGNYPGPGITLGPALVFGYLAAMHLARGG